MQKRRGLIYRIFNHHQETNRSTGFPRSQVADLGTRNERLSKKIGSRWCCGEALDLRARIAQDGNLQGLRQNKFLVKHDFDQPPFIQESYASACCATR